VCNAPLAPLVFARTESTIERASARKRFLILPPILLIVGAAFVFGAAARWPGDAPGYLVGCGCYWLWRLSVPPFLWGRCSLHHVIAAGDPLFSAGAFWMYFVPGLAPVSFGVLLFSPIAIISGTAEEILWRGVYVQAFEHNAMLGYVYPAAGLARFHLVPTPGVSCRRRSTPIHPVHIRPGIGVWLGGIQDEDRHNP
jgi:membrane protease YdiL (CAAX protease family)